MIQRILIRENLLMLPNVVGKEWILAENQLSSLFDVDFGRSGIVSWLCFYYYFNIALHSGTG